MKVKRSPGSTTTELFMEHVHVHGVHKRETNITRYTRGPGSGKNPSAVQASKSPGPAGSGAVDRTATVDAFLFRNQEP